MGLVALGGPNVRRQSVLWPFRSAVFAHTDLGPMRSTQRSRGNRQVALLGSLRGFAAPAAPHTARYGSD